MKSTKHGKNISSVKVIDISFEGIVILANDNALYLTYDKYPWFKNKDNKAINNVTEPTPNHYYWPDLDIDLSYDIIKHPERFECKMKIDNKLNQYQ